MAWVKLPDQKKPLADQVRTPGSRAYMRGQRQHWIVAARCVCTTPFGFAVEPEEKKTSARSDGATSAAIASTTAAGAFESPSTNSCQPSMAPPSPSMSPMHTARRRNGSRRA